MRALLIDVSCQCLQMVDIGLAMQDVYDVLQCTHITAVYPLPFAFSTDLFYVDDDALCKPLTQNTGGFFLGEPRQPIFGNALIVGCDRNGHRIEPVTTLREVCSKIRFLEQDEVLLYHGLLERESPKIFYW